MVEKLATPPSFLKIFSYEIYCVNLYAQLRLLKTRKTHIFCGICIYGILVYVKIEIKFKVQGKSFMKQKNEEKKNLLS